MGQVSDDAYLPVGQVSDDAYLPVGQVLDDAHLHYGQVLVAKCVHGDKQTLESIHVCEFNTHLHKQLNWYTSMDLKYCSHFHIHVPMIYTRTSSYV